MRIGYWVKSPSPGIKVIDRKFIYRIKDKGAFGPHFGPRLALRPIRIGMSAVKESLAGIKSANLLKIAISYVEDLCRFVSVKRPGCTRRLRVALHLL
jgi:hypothetical protein